MLALDWSKLDQTRATTTLYNTGVGSIDKLTLSQILTELNLGSREEAREHFPERSIDRSRSVNIADCVNALTRAGLVKDIIGSRKLYHGSNIYFLTLVSPDIKQYLWRYVEIITYLRKECNGLNFLVWLEDQLSVMKDGRNEQEIKASIEAYRNFFSQAIQDSKILVSSEVSNGIPIEFANTHLAKLTGNDLLSLLPYYYRNPKSTSVLDIVHFAWMCYLIQKCPGIHLTGANTNRQYQLYHRISGGNMTALLVERH
jgi:hypothetical protein